MISAPFRASLSNKTRQSPTLSLNSAMALARIVRASPTPVSAYLVTPDKIRADAAPSILRKSRRARLVYSTRHLTSQIPA